MKYIGEGFYYKVYEYEAGRVLKKLLPAAISFKKVYDFTRERGNKFRIEVFLGAYKSVWKERKELSTMKEKLKVIPSALFANPEFIGKELDYMQDKVIIIEDTLRDDEEGKAIIDKYIELQKKLWSYGMHDATYKMQPNYGIDKNSNVVCIDFGEFVFTKEQVIESIGKKKWLLRGSYKKWEGGKIKDYYTDQMAKTMTKEIIEKFWATYSS